MMEGALILLAPAVPLALALLCAVPSPLGGTSRGQGADTAPLHRAGDSLARWASLPALVLALYTGSGTTVHLPWLVLGTQLGVTPLTRVFLLFTALLWLLAGHFARADLADDLRRRQFNAFFLASLAGNIGLILARDLASFYMFFALMTFAAYGLVVHSGEERARRAGRVYIAMAVLGEAALLAGLMLAAANADSLEIARLPAAIAAAEQRDAIVALLLAGFGVKAGALALHLWLPLAHPVAPTAASAVLSGAMIKAGLLGWLLLLPLGAASMPGWSAVVIAIGVAAAFYAAIAGILQDDTKTVLAYSSVSQMGYMMATVGIAFLSPELAPAAIMAAAAYALHHGLAKGALFLGVRAATGGYRKPWMPLAILALPAAALAGAPLTSGAAAKTYLKNALPDAPWADHLALLLSLAAIGTTIVLGRFLFLMHAKLAAGTTKTLPARGHWAWLASIAASMTALWIAPLLLAMLPTAPVSIGSALWPVLAGVALLVAFLVLPAPHVKWRVPPGDVLVFVRGALGSAAGGLRWLAATFDTLIGRGFEYLCAYQQRLAERNAALSIRGERRLLSNAGFAVFLVLLLLALAGSWSRIGP